MRRCDVLFASRAVAAAVRIPVVNGVTESRVRRQREVFVASSDHDQDDIEATVRLDGSASPGQDTGDLSGENLLGRYRVGVLLGKGGMGSVYMAEQLVPVQRTVALKLLDRSRMDLRRRALFEIERQMLARMQHSAIAQIFDAGTTDDGVPFFAMEYIDGVPVTAFARQQSMDLRQRLGLFVQICDGVQHAHQKGVIHRDLKPVNILVSMIDGQPRAKIIDFGIAMIAESASAAVDEPVAGTPSYMSPEQLAGDGSQIDTRTDVYSLGIVLYELLTGARPDAPSVTRRITGESMSTLLPPSRQLDSLIKTGALTGKSLRRSLRDELDHVVLRAAHPERGQRYPSVVELAADIRRFLDGRPVEAVPQTTRYLMGKLIRRHRVPLMAAAVGVVAVIVGLLVSLYGLREAHEQRGIAERRQLELEQVVAFQQSMLKDIDVYRMGRGIVDEQRRQLARLDDGGAASAMLDRLQAAINFADVARSLIDQSVLVRADQAVTRDFADQPAMAADLRMAIGEVYFALGSYEAAVNTFRDAAESRGRVLDEGDPDTIRSLIKLGNAQDRLGRLDDALVSYEQARALLDAHHPDVLDVRAELDLSQAWSLSVRGQSAEALELLEAAVEHLRSERGNHEVLLYGALNTLGIVQARAGDQNAARGNLEEALAGWMRHREPEDQKVLTTKMNLANVYDALRENDRALALLEDVYSAQQRRLGAEHPITLMVLSNVASNLTTSGRHEEALQRFREVATTRTAILGADHHDTLRVNQNIANTLLRLGRYEEALLANRQSYDARVRVLGPDHRETRLSQEALSRAYRETGNLSQARWHMEDLLAAREATLPAGNPLLLGGRVELANVIHAMGDSRTALTMLETVLATWESNGREGGEDTAQDAAIVLIAVQRALADEAGAARTHARFLQPLLDAGPQGLNQRQRRIREQLLADTGSTPEKE